jgi:glutathione-regulated potassium-efflux system ancillary protein KefC
MNLTSGHYSFAVLLFQDLAVIPMVAVLAILAPANSASAAPLWLIIGKALAAIAAVILGGRLILRPVFRYIAQTHLREVFTAFSLLLVTGIAMLMQAAGLSMALGTFLAGVLLAESEYRHELEIDIEPFKGLLLGLFFISVGMSADLGLLLKTPLLILGFTLSLVTLKVFLLGIIGMIFKIPVRDNWIFALALSQVGEFAFVLYNSAAGLGIFPRHIADFLTLVVAISMASTP